jgi:hypothetical protein
MSSVTPLTNATIKEAVELWLRNKEQAISEYGYFENSVIYLDIIKFSYL